MSIPTTFPEGPTASANENRTAPFPVATSNTCWLSETGFMKYCRFGIPLLSNLSGFYKRANVEIKQKLLGSIFPAKLHFRENSYRTTPLNPALALILQKNKALENEKTGQILFEESLSGELPIPRQL